MTTQEKIDVMLAFDAGTPIQRRRLTDGTWVDCSDPGWNFFAFEYRIKPEPVIRYVLTYPDGSTWQTDSKQAAIDRWSNTTFNPTLQRIEETTNE